MLSGDARPFDHPGDHRGVLCVHGFTGTPFEMHYVGRRLAERGFTVVGPLLPGHGGTPDDLDRTTWRDWFSAIERELDALRRRCRVVAVVGLSLGGLLTLHLSRRHPDQIAAIAALGTPLWLPRYAERLIPWARRAADRFPRLAHIPKLGGPDVRDPEMRRRNPALRVFPVRPLASLLEFTRVVRAEVDLVTAPAFVAHGRLDHTAPPACSVELARRLGTRDVKYLSLPESFHVVTIDVERETLAEELARFLAERM